MGYTKYSSKYLFNKNSKFYKNEQEADCSGDLELKEMSRKVWIKRIQLFMGSFWATYSLCGKRRRLSPCNLFKNVEPGRSFYPFQNGRPFSDTLYRREIGSVNRTWRMYYQGSSATVSGKEILINPKNLV